MKRRIAQLLLLSFIHFTAKHYIIAQNITLQDLNNIVTLSNPKMSPDGKSAIFMATHRDYDNNRHNQELIHINLETSTLKTLVKGEITDMDWSPDGKILLTL
ncbi:MAG: hypothetical protein ACK4TA_13300 [Saprospiraceae bacterium]